MSDGSRRAFVDRGVRRDLTLGNAVTPDRR